MKIGKNKVVPNLARAENKVHNSAKVKKSETKINRDSPVVLNSVTAAIAPAGLRMFLRLFPGCLYHVSAQLNKESMKDCSWVTTCLHQRYSRLTLVLQIRVTDWLQ